MDEGSIFIVCALAVLIWACITHWTIYFPKTTRWSAPPRRQRRRLN